ncbi:flagellar M-ring protein FliF [bacterium DOLZORAL124_64_63]|nr:MAG: flagellar M-ring protein FliF [bacterium DOLZORAL124_64_63]
MAFRDAWLSLRAVISGLTPGRRMALMLLILGSMAGFFWLIFWAGTPDFQPLYTNLQPEDAGAVVQRLKEDKIPYRAAGANTILVPRERIFETTMMLAGEGLPQSGGVGFEIFDRTKLGMTEFEQNVNYQRALQGEISRTITRLAEVRTCRVLIVMPEESLFVEQDRPASASVQMELHPGKKLKQQQVQAIIHIVSAAVPDLSPEDVTVMDNFGNLLSAPRGAGGIENSVTRQLEFQQRMERIIQQRVESMLDEVLGPGKSIVRVSCELDFKRQEITLEQYDPEKVLRSEQKSRSLSTESGAGPSGAPGVLSNMAPGGRGAAAGEGSLTREQEIANYELNKTIQHIISPVGMIRRISAAVIVDGTYTLVKTRDKKGKETETRQYTARSPDEIGSLVKIVRRAVNFDPARGDAVEVINLPFQPELRGEEEEASMDWRSDVSSFLPVLKYLFAGVVLIFLFLMVLRPLIKWLTSKPVIDGRMLQQLPMTVGEMERELGEGGDGSVSSQLSQAIAADTDGSAARLIRDLIREKPE